MSREWKTFLIVLVPIITVELILSFVFNILTTPVLIFIFSTTAVSMGIWFVLLKLKGK